MLVLSLVAEDTRGSTFRFPILAVSHRDHCRNDRPYLHIVSFDLGAEYPTPKKVNLFKKGRII